MTRENGVSRGLLATEVGEKEIGGSPGVDLEADAQVGAELGSEENVSREWYHAVARDVLRRATRSCPQSGMLWAWHVRFEAALGDGLEAARKLHDAVLAAPQRGPEDAVHVTAALAACYLQAGATDKCVNLCVAAFNTLHDKHGGQVDPDLRLTRLQCAALL